MKKLLLALSLASGVRAERGDVYANVPDWELAWLGKTLAIAPGPTVVFGHQCLDPSADPNHLVRNAAAVREVLERSGKVAAVFTGHEHNGGGCVHNGIFCYTLRALVKASLPASNGFAGVEIYPSGLIRVTGFAKAASRTNGKNEILKTTI